MPRGGVLGLRVSKERERERKSLSAFSDGYSFKFCTSSLLKLVLKRIFFLENCLFYLSF